MTEQGLDIIVKTDRSYSLFITVKGDIKHTGNPYHQSDWACEFETKT
jgi:hypothetical protein